MNKIYTQITLLAVFFTLFSSNAFGQSVAINTDGSPANSNAMLDVKSANKGILIPRIDYNNRPLTDVPSGMLIYVIANGPLGNNAYYFYDGTKWLRHKTTDDVQTLTLSQDTLRISEGNFVVVGNILNQIGYYKCDAVYTQVASNVNHCGSCGNVCSSGVNSSPTCTSGNCGIQCNTGYGNCDNNNANGCEVFLSSSASNCGSCGNVCSSGPNSNAICSGGNCGLQCNAGFGNCDNNNANGCEVSLSSSVNCGSCGVVCPGVTNGSPTCTSGQCGIICNVGFTNCGNSCVSLNSNQNCGACGVVCPVGQTCTSGVCL